MSAPTNHAPPPSQYPYNPNQFMSNQQQYNYAALQQQASSIPGASGGRGDPGPSSMAQNLGQGQPGQNQGGIRPNISPAHMALLQQVTTMARSSGMNLTPHQLQAAVQTVQSQGGLNNPAAVMNALRFVAAGMSGPGGQGAQQQMAQMGMGMNMGLTMGQGQGPAQMQMAQFQQQLGQPGQPQFPQMQGQQPLRSQSGEIPAFNHTSQQNRLQQLMQHGSPNSSHTSSPRPQPTPYQSSMPPPALLPGMPSRPMAFQNGQPRFTQQQQQFLASTQAQMMANPQFQSLTPQQQQYHLNLSQQRFLAALTNQSQTQQMNNVGPNQNLPGMQQPLQQHQNQQQQAPPNHDSPRIARQSTPVHAPSPQPMSSLPQHMITPRPGSAASQRAETPHRSGSPMAAGTPPAPFTPGPPASVPSPAHSVHSHHSHPQQTPQNVQTTLQQPQQTSQPQQSASPHMSHLTTPIPSSMRNPTPIDINGQLMQHAAQHMGRPPLVPIQQQQQQLQPGQPPPVIPPGNFTPQQQQQMANAMSVFSQTMGQGQNAVRPNQALGRPPAQPNGNGNTAGPLPPLPPSNDFPFDWRYLQHFPHLNNPTWRAEMQAKNPQLLASVQQASNMVSSGMVRQDIMQRMQQTLLTMRMYRPPPSGSNVPAGVPLSIGASHPVPASIGRPPLNGGPSDTPHLDRRVSAKRDQQQQLATQQQQPQQTGINMPPPTWIPGQPPIRPADAASAVTGHTAGPGAFPFKEWEAYIRADLPITTITALPTNTIDENSDPTFGGLLRSLSESETTDIKAWMEKDKEYAKVMADKVKRSQTKTVNWAKATDLETPWWMVRRGERYQPPPPYQKLRIIWPHEKVAMRAKTSHRGRREIRFNSTQMKSMAEVEDHLIPVRLDIEHDSFRMKDTFMWNVMDTVVTPEVFAHSLCDDFGVSPASFVPKIVNAITERIMEYRDQIAPLEQISITAATRGKLDPDNEENSKALIELYRKAADDAWTTEKSEDQDVDDNEEVPELLRHNHTGDGSIGSAASVDVRTDIGDPVEESQDQGITVVEDGENDDVLIDATTAETEDQDVKNPPAHVKRNQEDEDRPMTVEEAMACVPDAQAEDLRLLIKIDIIVGTQNLSDTFEWDLNSEVTPEEFAWSYCSELGLSGEFATAISHDIHEQVMVHKRCLFLVGHTFGSGMIADDEVRSAFLPPLTQVLRKEDVAMSSFTPIFATFTDEDIVAIERERERDLKRKKRATRARRGIALPEREPAKTHRSLLNPIGPNGAVAPVVDPATATNAPVPSSRRAAAIAAQANINLLAQDLPIPAPPSPVPAPPAPTRGRGRGRGRGGGNLSRASPASFREGSVANGTSGPGDYSAYANFARDQTPLPSSSLKRSIREDTSSDIASPIPKKRSMLNMSSTNGRRSDDEGDSNSVKLESDLNISTGSKRKIDDDDDATIGTGRSAKISKMDGWHCQNCGIPGSLSGGARKDLNGNSVLCGVCSRYLIRTRKPRPIEQYTQDPEWHRQKLEANKRTTSGNTNNHNLTISQMGSDTLHPGLDSSSFNMDSPISSASTPSMISTSNNKKPKDTGFVPSSPSPSDSGSDSSSGSELGSNLKKTSTQSLKSKQQQQQQQQSHLGMGSSGQTAPPVQRSVSGASATTGPPPSWVVRAHAELSRKYPTDQFMVVPKPKAAGEIVTTQEWRMKCADCPGRIYSLGPGETLNNFEVHLKNRGHMNKVQERLSGHK